MKRIVALLILFASLTTGVFAQSTIVADVRAAIARNDLAGASELVSTFRRANGTTAEALAALSWVGRGMLAAGNNDQALSVSRDTHRLVLDLLKTRPLDADTFLPTALGAAIETEAKAMVALSQRASAVLLLQQELTTYRNTSIRGRLQKNLNLLSLNGQPAPALTAAEHLGAPMPSTKGHPVVLFFWAHWCPDCKAQAPIIAELQRTYGQEGLVVIGPTRRYGSAAGGADASPQVELAHIESVRKQYYAMIADMAVPVSNEDALEYGMDATPTLVLIDRAGKVALYHPGRMTREELEPHIKQLVGAK